MEKIKQFSETRLTQWGQYSVTIENQDIATIKKLIAEIRRLG